MSNVVREVGSLENGQIKTNNMGYMKFFVFVSAVSEDSEAGFSLYGRADGTSKTQGGWNVMFLTSWVVPLHLGEIDVLFGGGFSPKFGPPCIRSERS